MTNPPMYVQCKRCGSPYSVDDKDVCVRCHNTEQAKSAMRNKRLAAVGGQVFSWLLFTFLSIALLAGIKWSLTLLVR